MKSKRQISLPYTPSAPTKDISDSPSNFKEYPRTLRNSLSIENFMEPANTPELYKIKSSTERTPKSQSITDFNLNLSKPKRKISRSEVERLLNEYQAAFDCGRTVYTIDCVGPKLGPGYYNIGLSTLGGTSFQFGTSQRFRRPESLTILSTQEKFKSAADIFKQNKDMAQYQPSNKIYLTKIKSEIETARISQAKKKKEYLMYQKRIDIQNKIEDKQRRLIMKVKRHQISQIAKTWIILFVVASWNTEITCKIQYRKDLHMRSQKVLKQLFILCTYIGKFKILSKAARVNLAVKRLQILSKPIHCHLNFVKNAYKNRVIDVFERAVTCDTLFQLMAWWRNRLLFIQRTLRHAFLEKKTSMIVRKTMWNKVEYKIHREQLVKKRKLSKEDLHKPIEPIAVLGNSSIPDVVKEFYIKNKLKERYNEYLAELKKYNEEIKARKSQPGGLVDENGAAIALPDKPARNYILLDSDYKKMMHDCIENRAEWQRIIDSNTN
ncbi:unnamed protein product [Blepharisma stoltei]|uniref:IQ calmodulin-binding motif family protein n=1 Tax=Blepharisma stoltei TaxID=1481888 RepID=A0AAU9IDV2_9CILI|nr:unnamed protein product [Blepharisma stoltei]